MRPKPHTGYTSLLKGSDFVFQSGFNTWPRTISLQVSTWFRLQHHDLLQPQCLRTHSKRPHLSVVKFLKSVYSVYHPACYLQTAAVTLQNHFAFLLRILYRVQHYNIFFGYLLASTYLLDPKILLCANAAEPLSDPVLFAFASCFWSRAKDYDGFICLCQTLLG